MTLHSSSSPGLTGGPKPTFRQARRPAAGRGMTRWGSVIFLALIATPALAHEGHHEQLPFGAALRHLLSEPDHQLAFAGLVVLAITGGWFWRRAKARK
jgi:hypothetical protein